MTLEGRRARVWDYRLYKDDKKTPTKVCFRKATIVQHYGKKIKVPESCGVDFWYYPDLVDVIFDHRPGIVSRGHFTSGIKLIDFNVVNK